MEFPRSRRIYLDADVVAAAALEPAARARLLELKRTAIIRLSQTVVQEMGAAPRDVRHRLTRAALEVCHCITTQHAPEILQMICQLPEETELPDSPVVPIGEL